MLVGLFYFERIIYQPECQLNTFINEHLTFVALVLKVNIGFSVFLILYMRQGFVKTTKTISFQNDSYVLPRRSVSKGPIVLNIHTFHFNVKHSTKTFTFYKFCLNMS